MDRGNLLVFVGQLAFHFLLVNSNNNNVFVVVGHGDHSSQPPPSPDSLPISPPKLVIMHIILQLLTWGLVLPMGVLLGLGRSRLHGPVQTVAGLLLSLPATTLPHLSARHPYPPTLHATLGSTLFVLLLLQICQGFFLQSHRLQGSRFRALIQLAHSIIGKSFIPLSWLQILLGAVASLSFCYGDHLGQCLAHMIMGSAFVGYGVVMLGLMEFGKPWLKSHQLSPEYLDCCVITVWGVVNTFTEHGFFFSAGPRWTHKDLQHTFLGVMWASGGGLGIYLSRGGRRSVMSGVVIIVTGWAFQSHQQSLELSTRIHGAFGATLMAAGLVKIITVVRRAPAVSDHHVQSGLDPLDHLTPLLLTISGVMFMSATEEQLLLISRIGVDQATYILGQASLGCLLYLYINLFIHFYRRATDPLRSSSGLVDPVHAALLLDDRAHDKERQGSPDPLYERLSMESFVPPQLDPSHLDSSSSESFDNNHHHS